MKCDHYKLMDTLRGERAKETTLTFQIRMEQRSGDGAPWVGRKLAGAFCALLAIILPDLWGRWEIAGAAPKQTATRRCKASLRSPRAGAEGQWPKGVSRNTKRTEGSALMSPESTSWQTRLTAPFLPLSLFYSSSSLSSPFFFHPSPSLSPHSLSPPPPLSFSFPNKNNWVPWYRASLLKKKKKKNRKLLGRADICS